jgi:hypothetical protein
MNFTQALRDLELAKRAAQPSAGVDVLMSAIAPFETLFTRFDSAQNNVPSEAPQMDPPAALQTSIPFPEPGVAPGAENGAMGGEKAAKEHSLRPNFLPFEPDVSAKSREYRGEENGRTRPGQNGAGKKPGSFLDQLQILPSRRGQYKKKT